MKYIKKIPLLIIVLLMSLKAKSQRVENYIKTRYDTTFQGGDLFDITSTDDGGVSYISAKASMDELVKYVSNESSSNIYSVNGTLTGERTVDMAGFNLNFESGNIIAKSNGVVGGFVVLDSSSQLMGGIAYDPVTKGGSLGIIDSSANNIFNVSSSSFKYGLESLPQLYVSNDKVGINTRTPLEKFQIGTQFTFRDTITEKAISNNAYFSGGEHRRIVNGVASTIRFTDLGEVKIAGARSKLVDSTITWNYGVIVNSSGNMISNDLTTSAGGGVSIGDAGAADPSAILDLNSTTKGLLVPRMTSGQRDAIVSPTPGLIIYNSTTGRMQHYEHTTPRWRYF